PSHPPQQALPGSPDLSFVDTHRTATPAALAPRIKFPGQESGILSRWNFFLLAGFHLTIRTYSRPIRAAIGLGGFFMKTRIIGFFPALALTLGLPSPAGAPAAPPAPKAKAAAVATTPVPERHPEIHAAIESLENARRHLKEARHDFGGHREEALRATD